MWIKRKNLYTQLQSILDHRSRGVRVNRSNFLRACENNQITDPFALSWEEAETCIVACERIAELHPVAPLLRDEHLRNCLGDARRNGNRPRQRFICQIMAGERSRRRWNVVKKSTKLQSGGAPTAIKIKQGEVDLLFDTWEGVEEQAARKLTDRFKLGRDAPISSGELFDDIGYLGDTTLTRAILEGSYEYPPEMCPHTWLLFV